jgi:restriction endonuclease S subunit
MKRANQPNNKDQGVTQDWKPLQVGDEVEVIESGGYTYAAYIETKSEKSDILWIRACGFGTRQLLHELDGTRLLRKEAPEARKR